MQRWWAARSRFNPGNNIACLPACLLHSQRAPPIGCATTSLPPCAPIPHPRGPSTAPPQPAAHPPPPTLGQSSFERRSVVGTSGASGSSSSYTKAVRLQRAQEGHAQGCGDRLKAWQRCGGLPRLRRGRTWHLCAAPTLTTLRVLRYIQTFTTMTRMPPASLLHLQPPPTPPHPAPPYRGRKSSATLSPAVRCLGSKKKLCTVRPMGLWKVNGWRGERGGEGAGGGENWASSRRLSRRLGVAGISTAATPPLKPRRRVALISMPARCAGGAVPPIPLHPPHTCCTCPGSVTVLASWRGAPASSSSDSPPAPPLPLVSCSARTCGGARGEGGRQGWGQVRRCGGAAARGGVAAPSHHPLPACRTAWYQRDHALLSSPPSIYPSDLLQQRKVQALDQVRVRHVTTQVLAVLVRHAAQVALQGGAGVGGGGGRGGRASERVTPKEEVNEQGAG